MSVVDNRVVQMTFDNKQFQEGIEDSLKSLQKFEASLDTKDLEKKFNVDGISRSLIRLTNLFDPLAGAAQRAFIRMADSAVNAGVKMVKSLSIDNIAAGWDKFGQKTTSVGTLIAQGFKMDEVEDQLERLNWFTDETSYNFTDMVNNIGKFTAAGKGLEESVTAMEGIANWAALSGQNATTASRAMYQISQAMGAGKMRYEDYKSIQNASMDTDEFRQKALDAAVALGKLKKTGKDTYAAIDEIGELGAEFTKAQFTTQLTEDGWFNSEVMMRVFNSYSAATNQIKEFQDAYDLDNANQAIQKMKEMGVPVDAFGLKAFAAAQEARTFTDVIDSVKDAVSTGFMNMFEIMFGNYEKSKVMFTDMANYLYEVFATPINNINDFLDEAFNDDGGKRTEFIQTLANLGKSLVEIWNLVAESVRNVWEFNGFLPVTVEQFKNLIDKVKGFTEKLVLSDNYIREKLEKTLTGFFSILHIGWSAVKRIGGVIVNVGKKFTPVLDIILAVTAGIGDFFRILDNSISTIGFFNTFLDGTGRVLEYARIAFSNFKRMLLVTFDKNPAAKKFYEDHKAIFTGLYKVAKWTYDKIKEPLNKIPALFEKFVERVRNIKFDFGFSFDKFKMPNMTSFWQYVNDFGNQIRIAGENIVTLIDEYTGINLYDMIPPIPKNLPDLSGIIDWINNLRINVVGKLNELAAHLFITYVKFDLKMKSMDWKQSITNLFKRISDTITYVIDNFQPIVKRLAALYVGFILALHMWQGVKTHKAINGLIKSISTAIDNVTGLFGVADAIRNLGKYIKTMQRTTVMKAFAQMLLSFAGGVFIMAEAIYILTRINWSATNAKVAVGIVAGISIVMVLFAKYLSKTDWAGMAQQTESSSNKMLKTATSVLAIGAGLALLVHALRSITKYFEEYQNANPQLIFASLSTLGLMMVGLAATAALMSRWAPQMMKGAAGMISMVLAVWLMIKPLKALTEYLYEADVHKWDMLDVALQRLGALMLEMAVFCLIVNQNKTTLRSGIGNSILIYTVVSAITKLITVLSKIDKEQLMSVRHASATLLVTMGVITGLLAYLAKLSNTADLGKASKAFKEMTNCFIAIGATLGLMEHFSSLLRSAGAGIEILAVMGVMLYMLERLSRISVSLEEAMEPLRTMTLCVVAIGAILSLMAYVFKDREVSALVGFGALIITLLTSFGVLRHLAEQDFTRLDSARNALGIAAASVVAIGLTLSKMAEFDWPALIGPAASIGVALLAIGGVLTAMSKINAEDNSKIITMSFGLLVASVGIIAVAKAFSMMQNIKPETMEAALVVLTLMSAAMALIIGILAKAAVAAPEFAAAAVVMALVIGIISASLLAIAGSIYLFALAIDKMDKDGTVEKAGKLFDSLGEKVREKINEWKTKMPTVIGLLKIVLRHAWDELTNEVVKAITTAFLKQATELSKQPEKLKQKIETLKRAVNLAISVAGFAIKRKFKEWGENLVKGVVDFFAPAINKIVEYQKKIKEFKDIIEKYGVFGTLAANFEPDKVIDETSFWNKSTWMTGVDAIIDGYNKVSEEAASAYLAAQNKKFGIDSPSKKTAEIGKYLCEGLALGISKNTQLVDKTTTKTSKEVLGTFRDTFGVKSPSTETFNIGEYLCEGLANGIESKAKLVEDVTNWLATQNITSISDAIDKGKRYLTDKINGFLQNPQSALSEGFDISSIASDWKEQLSGIGSDIGELKLPDVSFDIPEIGGITSDIQKDIGDFSNIKLDTSDWMKQTDGFTYSLDGLDNQMADLSLTQTNWMSQLEANGPIMDQTTRGLYAMTDATEALNQTTGDTSKSMEEVMKNFHKIEKVDRVMLGAKALEYYDDYYKLKKAGILDGSRDDFKDYFTGKENVTGVKGYWQLISNMQEEFAKERADLFTRGDIDKIYDDEFKKYLHENMSRYQYDWTYMRGVVPTWTNDWIDAQGFKVTQEQIDQMMNAVPAQNGAYGYGGYGMDYTSYLSTLTNDVDSMNAKLNDIYTRINQLQVVLDTGAIAGAVMQPVDNYIGTKMIYAARGMI